ncbi:L-lactate permease [Tribonema minus]|nr:L-lactate permease [Tribonema minus]
MIQMMVRVTGGNRVAQLMLLGYSFMTLLEGCSGFGTPLVAIAPVLVAIGHDKIAAITFLLITNSLVTSFGAAGTPMWYGLGTIDLEDSDLVEVGFLTSIGLGALSAVFLPVACAMCTSTQEVRDAWLFIVLSTLSGTLPLMVTAYFSYTFPAIIAGLVGCVSTFALIKFNVGIKTTHADDLVTSLTESFKAASPIIGTVVLLLLTRIPQIGIKDLLTRTEPSFMVDLGTYGDASFSASLVFQLRSILTSADVNFKFQLLYVPFIIPFVLVSILTLIAFSFLQKFPSICGATLHQIKHPAQTLFGALVLVELMVVGGDLSPAAVIGDTLSTAVDKVWVLLAPMLGSLGSFVAGSLTVSNLTFGAIQSAAAINVGLNENSILALQCCGASIGTSICIFHIVACGASLGEAVSVGPLMKRLGPMVVLGDLLVIGVVMAVAQLL